MALKKDDDIEKNQFVRLCSLELNHLHRPFVDGRGSGLWKMGAKARLGSVSKACIGTDLLLLL